MVIIPDRRNTLRFSLLTQTGSKLIPESQFQSKEMTGQDRTNLTSNYSVKECLRVSGSTWSSEGAGWGSALLSVEPS